METEVKVQESTDHPEWYDDSDIWADSDATYEEDRREFLPGWEQS